MYSTVVLGKNSLHHLSFIVKWRGRRLMAVGLCFIDSRRLMPKSGSYRPKIRPKLYLMCSLYSPMLYVTHSEPGLPMGILFHLTKFISSTGESNVVKTALASRFVRGQVIRPSPNRGEKFSFKWVVINIADNYICTQSKTNHFSHI